MKTISTFDSDKPFDALLAAASKAPLPNVSLEDQADLVAAVAEAYKRNFDETLSRRQMVKKVATILREINVLKGWERDFRCKINYDILGEWSSITFEQDADHDAFTRWLDSGAKAG